MIGADALQAATGATGAGIKIGVVDDGIDQTNPYLSPAGFSYPAGFPKGNTLFTTPKVIVARSFPGPNSGAAGALPLDRNASFHGTHVSGIAAGDAGTNAPAGRDHPAVNGLSGVAPRAWLGNYRVFNVPTPRRPRRQHAGDRRRVRGRGRRRDGRDQLLRRRPADRPRQRRDDRDDPERRRGRRRAGDRGRQRPRRLRRRHRRLAGRRPRRDHRRGRLELRRLRADPLASRTPDAPASLQAIPFQSSDAPATWATVDQTLVDVGHASRARTASRSSRTSAAPPANPNGADTRRCPRARSPARSPSSRAAAAPSSSRPTHAQAAGAIGIVLVDNRSGEANPIPVQLPIPSGMITDLDGAQLRAYMATHGGKATIRAGGDPQQIATGRSGVITSFSSAGPTEWGHLLKPDISAPGGQILSSTLPEFAGSPFAVFDGTSMATPAHRGLGGAPAPAAPRLDAAGGQVGADVDRRAGLGRTRPARSRRRCARRAAASPSSPAPTDPRLFTAPASLSYPDLNVNAGAQSQGQLVRITDAGGGAGVWQVTLSPQSASAGTTIDVPGQISLAPGGEADLSVVANASAGAVAGDDYGFVVLTQGAVSRRIPYGFSVTRPGLAGETVDPAQAVPGRHDRRHGLARQRLPLPDRAVRPGAQLHRRADAGGRRRAALHDPDPESRRERRRLGRRRHVGRRDRPVHARIARRERRAGLRGHAGGRQQPHVRLPARRRRRGRRVPAPADVLRLGRLAPRPVHRASSTPASTSCAPGSTT